MLKKYTLAVIKFKVNGKLLFIFPFLLCILLSDELKAQQFVNGKLIRTQKSSIGQEYYRKIPKYIYNQGVTSSIFNNNIKVLGLDSLRHDFCPQFAIIPNSIASGGDYTTDSSSAVEIGFNGHNKSDFGFSLKLNSPLLLDSLYELNFLITPYGIYTIRQEFFNKEKHPFEDFKIYITQSTSSFKQEDTIAIIERKDIFEIDSNLVFSSKSRLGTLDDYYFKVRKKFRGKNNGNYITVQAKWIPSDSAYRLTSYNSTRIEPNSPFYYDAQMLNFGLIATYFQLKCPFEIVKSGELCSSSNPAVLSSSSSHSTDKFLWSNGDTTSTIRINKPGIYWLEKNRNGCGYRDTIFIDSSLSFSTSKIQLRKCVDSMLILGNIDVTRKNIIWNQKDTNQSIKVAFPGNYIRLSKVNGCKLIDTFEIQEYPRHKAIDQLKYTTCQGGLLLLESNVKEVQWLRKKDLISTTYKLEYLGKENDTLLLKSRVNCWQADTVIIQVKECPPNIEDLIFVPNAFTPNNDGKNDVLKIQGLNITNIKMDVYNRWGEKLFSDSGVEVSWDGRDNNLEVPEGIYVIVLRILFVDSNGNPNNKFINRTIQLLR